MTNPNLAYIVAILDRSGSMINKVEDTIGGFNTFIAEQKKTDGEKRVTLAQFDHEYELPYVDLHIDDVPGLRLVPRGNTALLDAIGKTIKEVGRRLRSLPEDERPGSVTVLIMTDGHENCSRHYRQEQIKAMIEEQQDKYGWLFKFFGADITATKVGRDLGVPLDHSLYYAGTNTRQAFAAASRSTSSYSSSMASGLDYATASSVAAFTDSERDAAANAKTKSRK